MSLKKLAVGISDYKKLIDEDCYYVDKTLLIKEVMTSGEVILITRPRRFGKTLNQSMLRYFFEKSEGDNSYLFQDKKIWQKQEFREMQGQYPVIYLSFKDLKSRNYSESYEELKLIIAKEYQRHDYLLKSDKMSEYEIKEFQEVLHGQASPAKYKFSLSNLSEYLAKHHGLKTILLIDEYDTPIMAAYNNSYYEQFIDYFKVFLSAALKDNQYLKKSVLTGITRVAKESIFSGLNNLKVSTVLSDFYNDKFGLTREEVLELVEYYGLKSREEEIITWYDGYNFGGIEIYNPFSIINLADNEGKIQEYWINSSSNQLIKELIRKSSAEFKDGVLRLIEGQEISSDIEKNLVFNEIDGREENIWTLLLFSGYLKWVEHVKEREYKLKVPNQEVMFFYRYTVQNILKDQNIELESMINELLLGHIKQFKKDFKELTRETLSYFDTGEKNPEKFYHGLVLGMVVGLKDRYIIRSNRETGYGRADVILIPRAKKEKGLVIEFKKYNLDKDRDLKDSALKALKQIDEEGYEATIKAYGVSEIIKVGIAFKGKKVEIVSNLDGEKVLSKEEEIAKNLLASGVDIEVIAKTTGLEEKEIIDLDF
ncbi:AAA family ATPase [Fuchsiella alkaliacetigena]|uniref:AAA family ATPase n=1 Tax=Fuchsiella alkaliacetigena TaxID=957042 RepID=UPI00200A5382|nr:AAA family ATPase [Fuchsiella alkaliacetigena]MCK8824965.1 ATP-binding protein [Fuchsiella alkaliacetigena]